MYARYADDPNAVDGAMEAFPKRWMTTTRREGRGRWPRPGHARLAPRCRQDDLTAALTGPIGPVPTEAKSRRQKIY